MAGRKITRICETCNGTFDRYLSQVKRRGGKYCSPDCYHTTKEPTPEKFWSNVQKTDTCWPWLAGRSKGYGVFYWRQKQTGAHRVAYELTYGPIPNDLFVLHRCDNPPCVNPAHLFLGTEQDNMTDKTQKGRATHGTAQHCAILNEEIVREARRLYATGAFTYQAIADRFSVSMFSIHRAIVRRTWKHVE